MMQHNDNNINNKICIYLCMISEGSGYIKDSIDVEISDFNHTITFENTFTKQTVHLN